MADIKDLMDAISHTDSAIRETEAKHGIEFRTMQSNIAIACAIREASIRIEIIIRDAAETLLRGAR